MVTLFLVITMSSLMVPGSVSALNPPTSATPSDGYTTSTDSPLLITQYRATNDRLDYVELYNDSNQLFKLDGWSVEYDIVYNNTTQTIPLNVTLSGSMEPQRYMTIAETGTGLQSPFMYTISATGDGAVRSVRLVPPVTAPYLDEVVKNPSYTKSNYCTETAEINTANSAIFALKRNVSTISGDYLSSLCYINLENELLTVFIDRLYELPPRPSVEIVEIMPHAKSCSPFEVAFNCRDYIKVYNAGTNPLSMEVYRLRSGSQGSVPSTSNSVTFNGDIPPGAYRTYQVDLSNSGNWLWYEDVYGTISYEETAVQYPSASSLREGQAWMYDTGSGEWKWTTQLSGTNNPPMYVAPTASVSSADGTLQQCRADQFRNPLTNRCKLTATSTETVEPCAEGKIRNPLTNRCKSTASSTSTLTPCRSDQFRNPATNRCNNIASSANSLVPCTAGQTRNPATNRCKSDVSLANALKPCASNQERNPETNRCRKAVGVSIPVANFAVEPSPADLARNNVGWVAFAGVGSLAVGYGVWEWRREIIGGLAKMAGVFRK